VRHLEFNPPYSREVIMEIALIPGLFVAIFAVGAAAILWTPYDR
jgi:hypothetical protein